MDRKEYSKRYRDLNKKEIKEYKKKWYQKNKERIKEKSKEYYNENKEDILEKRKLYVIEKFGDDMNFVIKKNVLKNIKQGIIDGYWSSKTEKLLGYTANDLINHLKKFNVNEKWHIHHIIPVRVYNFYNEEDIKKCWSLDNIFPLEDYKRNNHIDWSLIEKKKLEYLLPETLMIDDLIGRHHEV